MLLALALLSRNISELERHHIHAVKAYRGAYLALDKAKNDPASPPALIKMLEDVLDDAQALVNKIEHSLPEKLKKKQDSKTFLSKQSAFRR